VVEIWGLNLRHLRAMATIARLGSLSAAARAVNVSQPALTQAVAGLEARLGEPLFQRRARGVGATEAALLLAPRIEAALAHIASPRVTMAQVRALSALARDGGYADAARATGLSEPSLHRAIGDLSIALGKPLVVRRGRGVALTPSGKRTARAFRLARAELDAGLAELAGLRGHETGRIAVGAMPLSRARILPQAVAAFHPTHPAVKIAVIEGSHAELLEPLRQGDLDLMIGALRDPAPGDDVIQRALFQDRPIVVGRRGHPLAGRSPGLAALGAFPWIVAAPGTPLRRQWQAMFSPLGEPAPAVPIECGSVITIRQILMESDFLALLSVDQVALELEAGWLAKVGDAPADVVRIIGVTTRADWRPTPSQRDFLAALTASAATLPQNL
jgi:LysR family transcriptional regulator of gallate degradation